MAKQEFDVTFGLGVSKKTGDFKNISDTVTVDVNDNDTLDSVVSKCAEESKKLQDYMNKISKDGFPKSAKYTGYTPGKLGSASVKDIGKKNFNEVLDRLRHSHSGRSSKTHTDSKEPIKLSIDISKVRPSNNPDTLLLPFLEDERPKTDKQPGRRSRRMKK